MALVHRALRDNKAQRRLPLFSAATPYSFDAAATPAAPQSPAIVVASTNSDEGSAQ
jgi:hypothetical protein